MKTRAAEREGAHAAAKHRTRHSQKAHGLVSCDKEAIFVMFMDRANCVDMDRRDSKQASPGERGYNTSRSCWSDSSLLDELNQYHSSKRHETCRSKWAERTITHTRTPLPGNTTGESVISSFESETEIVEGPSCSHCDTVSGVAKSPNADLYAKLAPKLNTIFELSSLKCRHIQPDGGKHKCLLVCGND